MKKEFEAEILAAQASKDSAEMQLADGLMYRVLDLLSGIDIIFNSSQPEYKNRILRAIFPEGLTIDLKLQKVRTPFLNYFMQEMCSESNRCEVLEIEKGPDFYVRPSGGE